MYSPDGFASLACALQDQCFFLQYQQPFVELMRLTNGSVILFFALQAIVWLLLIYLVYYLAKELQVKHLFLTPLIVLFGGVFFIDNFVGSFENDNIGILFILLAIIFFIKYRKTNNKWMMFTSFVCLVTSLAFWLWAGYLIILPSLYFPIAEQMVWVHWASWLFLFPIILLAIFYSVKYNKRVMAIVLIGVLVVPKLFIFATPFLLKFIDYVLDKVLSDKNKKTMAMVIIFALLLGSFMRVGLNTYNSWARQVEDEDCVTVNDEYFLRATKGLNYTYNQITIEEANLCKLKKSLLHS